MSKKSLSFFIIGISLLLSGCFAADTTGGTTSDGGSQAPGESKTYSSSQFSFQFPGNWDVIEQKDFTSDIPRETQVVIRNNIKNDTFTANINIVKNDLQTTKTSLDYAKEVLNRQRTGLLDYKETKREIINIGIGLQSQETYYTEFEARLNQTEPVTRFFQTYGVKDQAGYIIMGASSQQENSTVIDQLIKTVQSFKIN